MITLKIKNYSTAEKLALLISLEEASKELHKTIFDLHGAKPCSDCSYRVVCNDIENAIEFVKHEIETEKRYNQSERR